MAAAGSDLPLVLTLLRTIGGLTQQELAEAAGVRPSSISDYEHGKTTPGLETLERLLDAMGYPLSVVEDVKVCLGAVGGKRRLHGLRPDGAGAGRAEGGRALAEDLEIEQTAAVAGQAVERFVRASLRLQARRAAEGDGGG
jgi:transcriptional regulator with XRE-family HTH domain